MKDKEQKEKKLYNRITTTAVLLCLPADFSSSCNKLMSSVINNDY